MSQTEEKTPLTAAERKAIQRTRDKSRGFIEITVRVPADRTDEVRAWCAKLKPKKKPRDKSQVDLFEGDRDLSQSSEVSTERSEVSA